MEAAQINTSCETVTEPKQTQSSRCCFHEQLKLKKAKLSRAKSNKMAIAILIHCVLIYQLGTDSVPHPVLLYHQQDNKDTSTCNSGSDHEQEEEEFLNVYRSQFISPNEGFLSYNYLLVGQLIVRRYRSKFTTPVLYCCKQTVREQWRSSSISCRWTSTPQSPSHTLPCTVPPDK